MTHAAKPSRAPEALLRSEKRAATTVSELDSYLKERVPQINVDYNKPAQQPYAVIEPAELGQLEILFNPRRRRQAAQKFEPLMDKLIELHAAVDDFVAALEFLDKVKEKKQLDPNETKKVALIESLCRGNLRPATFNRAWSKANESPRGGGPQIKNELPPLT